MARREQHMKKIFGMEFFGFEIKETNNKNYLFSLRYCQLALWGAPLAKPSSKEISCKFIVNQLTTSLLTTTGNLTSSLGNTLGNILPISSASGGGGGGVAQLNQIDLNKQTDKSSSATAGSKHSGGILGVGIL